jgi:valyl-tRNA synthetase
MASSAKFYIGDDRFVARKKIVKDIDALGQLEKIEDLVHSVGLSERTKAVVEPKLSTQWFVNMKEMAKPALAHVMNDDIRFHPVKFKNVYRHWMENVRDWCISRQLWWGQRIPAYYLPDGQFVVAENLEKAHDLAKAIDPEITPDKLRQDEDVVDTWFSSWLLPFTAFNGLQDPDNDEIRFFYPTSTLVTGHDIIFFWVARMIIAGYEFKGDLPFRDVYFTGMVRDSQRRKMSKSLGNSPDPLDLIDTYGADAVRTGMLFSSPAGNDLLFDTKLCEQGRNFANKIWNAFRLVKGWQIDQHHDDIHDTAVNWFRSRLNQALKDIEEQFSRFRISDALMMVYKLIWNDFCSWYLEMIKPDYGEPLDRKTYEATISFFEELMQLLHPFMPFLTEEIWQKIRERSSGEYIVKAPWPRGGETNKELVAAGELAFELISQVRNTRNSKGISPKEALSLNIKTSNAEKYSAFLKTIIKLGNLSAVDFSADKLDSGVKFVIGADECSIPLNGFVDIESERKKLEEELKYAQGFLQSVRKKLSNDKFVNNAPEKVVAMEKKKMADAEAKIKALEESIAALN